MAIVAWPRRAPSNTGPMTLPRWRRLRRGHGLARLRQRGELVRPLLLASVLLAAVATLWTESGEHLLASSVRFVPMALTAVWRPVGEWLSPASPPVASWPAPPDTAEHATAGVDPLPPSSELPAPGGSAGAIELPPAFTLVGSTTVPAGAGDHPASLLPNGAAPAAAGTVDPALSPATSGPATVPVGAIAPPAAAPPTTVPATIRIAPTAASRPAPTATARAGAAPITHVVAPGDSLWALARQYGTTVEAIVQANRLTNPDQLTLGQRLIIPRAN